jgi:hypothetical protein
MGRLRVLLPLPLLPRLPPLPLPSRRGLLLRLPALPAGVGLGRSGVRAALGV